MAQRAIQVAIVAGGRGERLRPATDLIPKPMIPLDGKPLLEHQIEWLKSSGINEVFLCLGYKAEAITSYFGDGARWGMSFSYQIETVPRGTAGAVRDLLGHGCVASDLLVLYGDLYVAFDLRRLLAFHDSHEGQATLVLRHTDHPYDSDLADMQDGRITALYRAQPGKPSSTLACAAVWMVRRSLLEVVSESLPSDFGRDVFPQALSRGETVMGYITNESVYDLGTPERIAAFKRRRI